MMKTASLTFQLKTFLVDMIGQKIKSANQFKIMNKQMWACLIIIFNIE